MGNLPQVSRWTYSKKSLNPPTRWSVFLAGISGSCLCQTSGIFRRWVGHGENGHLSEAPWRVASWSTRPQKIHNLHDLCHICNFFKVVAQKMCYLNIFYRSVNIIKYLNIMSFRGSQTLRHLPLWMSSMQKMWWILVLRTRAMMNRSRHAVVSPHGKGSQYKIERVFKS